MQGKGIFRPDVYDFAVSNGNGELERNPHFRYAGFDVLKVILEEVFYRVIY